MDGLLAHLGERDSKALYLRCSNQPAQRQPKSHAVDPGGRHRVADPEAACRVVLPVAAGTTPAGRFDVLTDRGHTATIKPIPLRSAGVAGLTIDDFTVDNTAATVTCPNAITTTITRRGYATFGAKCRGCPLRDRCTTSVPGRSIKIHEHHDLMAAARAHALTTEFTSARRGGRGPHG